MPDVLVETRGGWLGARRAAFLEAIHAAMVEALRIPPDDKVLRLVEHPEECFAIPHGAGTFTHIEITMFAGLAVSQTHALSSDRSTHRAFWGSAGRRKDHLARGRAR